MSAKVTYMDLDPSDDEWEAAALAEIRADSRAYPGGVRKFVEDHGDRLEMSYNAYLDNLNGKNRISYRTFTRAVHLLGYSTQEYDEKILARIAATRRTA